VGRKMLVADLLCGAGGSSTGAARALRKLGLEMELVCVNHWPTAIETHKKNHPKARHYVQDIATVRPHLLVPEGYLDLLMASPTCTHHSVARGGKPTSDQQRSDPWHIITWLTELRVKRIIIENVWEFIGWGPVDPRTGKPIKSRKGEYFRAWIDTIRRLGFDPEWRKLNAADYGDATTRQRFILMARSDGKTVSWPVPTHRKREDGKLELFPGVKPWKPARDIIDWSIKGRSIYGRKKPLAAKTLARIYAGVVKHGWPEPYIVTLRNHMAAQGLDVPLPTIAAGGQHIGLATPILLSQHNSGAPRSADEPLPTITTGGAAAEDHPGCARPMLVEPFILNRHGEGYGESRAHSIDEPAPTANCDGGGYLVEPFVLSQGAGGVPRSVEREGQAPRVHSVDQPAPTIAATGHVDLVEPAPQYDILFRMLEPHELAAAMGFNTAEAEYEFAGTKTEKIKQIGNAVSVAKMEACVGALMADAAPKKAARPDEKAAAA
jgi:DNA (cytosine-5)-methyltransferase 1